MFNNQRVINKQWVISRIYIYIYFGLFLYLSIYITHLQATYTWTSLTYLHYASGQWRPM